MGWMGRLTDGSRREGRTPGLTINPLPALLGVSLLVFTACAVGPNYLKPTVPRAESYKEMEDWKTAEPRDDVLRGPWWRIFNDPQLNFLEEQVNISNQNIAIAAAQFRQSRALIQVARSAFFPTITTNPSVARAQGPSSLPSSQAGAATSYLLPFNLSWEIDLWGRIRRNVEAGRADAQASAADLENARLSAHADLAEAYFQLRALDLQKQLFDQAVIAYEKSLQLTENRYKSGVAARSEVLQAETQLKTTQAQAIDIDVRRAQIEHAIALLIGRPASAFSIPFSPLAGDAVPPCIPAGLPSELLERRPDIAAAERRVASANARIGVAMTAFFPKFTLNGSGGFEAVSLGKWLSWPSRFWSVGPALAETLFEGGLRRAQTEQARAAYDGTVASYRQIVLIGFQQVEDNLAALRILENEARIQDEAVKAGDATVVVTMNQYKAGVTSFLNVIVAQTTALSNRRVAAAILGRRLTAAVLLIKALGGGWEATMLSTGTHQSLSVR